MMVICINIRARINPASRKRMQRYDAELRRETGSQWHQGDQTAFGSQQPF